MAHSTALINVRTFFPFCRIISPQSDDDAQEKWRVDRAPTVAGSKDPERRLASHAKGKIRWVKCWWWRMSERRQKGGNSYKSNWCRSAFITSVATLKGETSQIRMLLQYQFFLPLLHSLSLFLAYDWSFSFRFRSLVFIFRFFFSCAKTLFVSRSLFVSLLIFFFCIFFLSIFLFYKLNSPQTIWMASSPNRFPLLAKKNS